MALSTGWQKLKVQAWGLISSASACADTTILAITCQRNQQKKQNKQKQIREHTFEIEQFSKCKSERTLSVAQTKTAVCDANCNITLCCSQNRIRELFSQKGRKSLFYLCSGR